MKREPVPFWFIAAIALLVASQLLRLQQVHAAAWIFWDYTGRLGALGLLAAVPSARAVAFKREQLKISWAEGALWIIVLSLVDYVLHPVGQNITALFPGSVLGDYPASRGWLHLFDVIFGLALVAYSEEIVFRRCAHHVAQVFVGDGSAMVAATALLFGAFHWWSGLGNLLTAALLGIGFMLFYRRSGTLWPVILVHYLIDIGHFA